MIADRRCGRVWIATKSIRTNLLDEKSACAFVLCCLCQQDSAIIDRAHIKDPIFTSDSEHVKLIKEFWLRKSVDTYHWCHWSVGSCCLVRRLNSLIQNRSVSEMIAPCHSLLVYLLVFYLTLKHAHSWKCRTFGGSGCRRWWLFGFSVASANLEMITFYFLRFHNIYNCLRCLIRLRVLVIFFFSADNETRLNSLMPKICFNWCWREEMFCFSRKLLGSYLDEEELEEISLLGEFILQLILLLFGVRLLKRWHAFSLTKNETNYKIALIFNAFACMMGWCRSSTGSRYRWCANQYSDSVRFH